MLLDSKQLRDHLEQAQDLDSNADGELKCHLIAELMFVLGIGELHVFNFDDALHQIALKVAAIRAEERRHAPEQTSTRLRRLA